VYADVCRNLYGATMVEWYMGPKRLETMTVGNTAFIPNNPGYTPEIEAICKVFRKKIDGWDRQSPLFLSAQGVSWNMTPANIRELAKKLDEAAPGCVEIVRADHFFCLYNQANGLACNLTLREDAFSDGETIDLGDSRTVVRAKIEAEHSCGFELYLSEDGENYTLAESTGIGERVYDFDLPAVRARYAKIVPAGDGRIVRAELFGM